MRSRDELERMAAEVPYWWHSIDLGKGVITNGVKPRENLEAERVALHLPPLKGKTVLDIGAWDGYFSFCMEQLGAARVVALDHYVWSMDLVAQQAYWNECQEKGVVPEPYHQVPSVWRPDELPGKKGFDTAREALRSKVESVVADLMETDPDELGTFDVVLYKGVLYHMRNPMEALRRVARVTGQVAIIETAAAYFKGLEDRALCEFFESDELNYDPSNWWAPNLKALHGMCRASGFARAETVYGPPEEAGRCEGPVYQFRAVVHAYK